MASTGDVHSDEPNAKPPSPIKGEKPQKAFSCLRCFERKVKCDKNHPCNGCVKSNVECVFRIPSAPRRKKKRATEEVLLERLKRAEDLLRDKGILKDSQPSQTTPSSAEGNNGNGEGGKGSDDSEGTHFTSHPPPGRDGLLPFVGSRDNFLSKSPYNTGKLIVSHGRSRFVDNNLWTSVSDEFTQPRDAIAEDSTDESDDESLGDDSGDIVLGLTPSSHSGVAHLHPNRETLFQLWNVYLENINPMTKIIHKPSLEKQLIQASNDMDSIPRGLECLMFSIYTCAVGSMSEEDCEQRFGEARDVLFKRYRTGCRRALARAKFLGTGDLMVCQSFVLYVIIMRETLDARTIYTLSGLANRIVQGLGLHRDGSELGLPVFETEMRRRLWWQLIILDFRSAELTGSGRFGDFWSDTHAPRNIDDIDFWPGITEQEFEDRIAQKGENRATEMITCLLRCEFGAFWREKLIQRSKVDPNVLKTQLFAGKPPSPWDSGPQERDATINELERRLEDKFLRYCDINIPLQFMASIIARGAVASMRLMAHHPRRWANETDIPASERTLLWNLSLKLLESDSLVHSTKALQRFMWHTNVYFQWQALVYLLGELKKRATGDDVDTAWRKIEEVYFHHPAFIIEFRKPLHAAVGSLCLKAWEARMRGRADAEAQGQLLMPIQTPEFIAMLREQRRAPTKRKSTGPNSSNNKSLSTTTTATDASFPIINNSGNTDITPQTSQQGVASTKYPAFIYEPSPNQSAGGYSGVPGRMPMDMSAMWETNNLPVFGTNQYAYEPMQAFGQQGMGQQQDGGMGGGAGGAGDGGGMGTTGGDVPMEMDWTQWDYLISDSDLWHTSSQGQGGQGVGMGSIGMGNGFGMGGGGGV